LTICTGRPRNRDAATPQAGEADVASRGRVAGAPCL